MHPVIKSPFIFCEARSVLEGAGFVISTSSPFHVGSILAFKDQSEYMSALGNNTWPVVSVYEYQILIQYAGSMLNGRHMVVTEPGVESAIVKMLGGMASFFYQERVIHHLGYYKKFLIK